MRSVPTALLAIAAPVVVALALSSCSAPLAVEATAAPVVPASSLEVLAPSVPSTAPVQARPVGEIGQPVAAPEAPAPAAEPAPAPAVAEAPAPVEAPAPAFVVPDVAGAATTPGFATTAMNVRGGPGTGFAVVGRLALGEEVARVATEGEWTLVSYNGSGAYVFASYVADAPPAPPAPAAAPASSGGGSGSDLIAGMVAPYGIDWGWDCLGTGPGKAAMALGNQVCFRSDLSYESLAGTVHHEMHHIMMWRAAANAGLSTDGVEARLRELYDPSGLLVKKAGPYAAIEVAADCWSASQTGHMNVRAYASSCPAVVTDAAVALWNGRMP